MPSSTVQETKGSLLPACTNRTKATMRVITLPVIDWKEEAKFIMKTDVLQGKNVPLHDHSGSYLGPKAVAMTVLKKCLAAMDLTKLRPLKSMQPLIIRQAKAALEILGAPIAEASFWSIRRSTTMHPAHKALAAVIALHVRYDVVHNLSNRYDPQGAKNDHRMSQMEEDEPKVATDAAVKTEKHASDTNEMKEAFDNQAEAGPSHEIGKERISKNDAAIEETSATDMKDHPAFEDIRHKKRKRDALCDADPTRNKVVIDLCGGVGDDAVFANLYSQQAKKRARWARPKDVDYMPVMVDVCDGEGNTFPHPDGLKGKMSALEWHSCL